MGYTFHFDFEVSLIEWFQVNVMTVPFLRNFFLYITELGDSLIIVLVIGFLYWAYDKKMGVYLAINVIYCQVLGNMIKNLVLRRRPYFDNENIHALKAVDDKYDIYDIKGQGFSFPSGHCTNGAAITTSIYRYTKNKRLLIILTIIYILVGISRFAIGVHYPSDVLAGYFFGFIFSLSIPYIIDKLGRTKAYIVLLLFGAIGFLFCKSNDDYSTYGLLLGFTLGDLFERKYVNFKNTRNIIKTILRLVLGAILFLAIIEGLKIPFSVDFLEADQFASHLFRCFRYAIGVFVIIGVYPTLFKFNILKLDDKLKG